MSQLFIAVLQLVALKHGWKLLVVVVCNGAASNVVKHRRQTAELQQGGTISRGYRLQNGVTVGPTCLLASQKISHKFAPCLPRNFSRTISKFLLGDNFATY